MVACAPASLDGSTRSLDQSAETAEEKSTAAICYLLSLVFPAVPPAVRKSRFDEISQLFLRVLDKYSATGSQALIKSVVTCLNYLLIVQSKEVWATKSAATCYHKLLSLTVSARAKIRKAAQASITLAVCTAAKTNPKHPVVTLAGHYCQKTLNKDAGAGTMYTLNMLRTIFPCFPMALGHKIGTKLLQLMTGTQQHMFESCMGVLKGLFDATDSHVSSKLLFGLLEALYNYLPDTSDTKARTIWNSTVASGFSALARLDIEQCFNALPRFCESLVQCFGAQNVAPSAAGCLIALLGDCVAPGYKQFFQQGTTNARCLCAHVTVCLHLCVCV